MTQTAAVTGRLAAEEMRDCETCGTPCYTKTCFRCAINEKNAAAEKVKSTPVVVPETEKIFDMAAKLDDYQSRDIWFDRMNSEDPNDALLVRQVNNAQRVMRHAANMLRDLAKWETEQPRIVIAMRKGVVTSVYLSDGPVAHSEVLIADEDAFDQWSQGDGHPKAALLESLPLEALNDVREIANMVLAYEGEEVSCAQCGTEFLPDAVIDGEFCTAACSDRHYRM